MASFICRCGEYLSNSSVPNEIQFHVYSDFEWQEIIRNDVINALEIPFPKNDVWKCPYCKRIYIFADNGETKVYVIEENNENDH